MNSVWTEYLQTMDLPPISGSVNDGTRFFAAHSDDALLSVRGKDASQFLQAQLSSDVTALAVGESQLSSYSSPKGLVLTTFRVYRVDEEHFYLRLSRSLAVSIGKRLKMYVLRDAVDIDIDESLGTLSLVGQEAEQWLASRMSGVPASVNRFESAEFGRALRAFSLIGADGASLPHFELLVDNRQLARVWPDLAREWPEADPSAADLARILSGEPQLTQASSEQFVAQSLNLHLNGGISFKKGCYPGQEQVAKTQYRGRLRSQLFRLEGTGPLASGDSLYGQPQSQSAVATVISSATAGDRQFALAVVRLKSVEKGLLYNAEGDVFDIHEITYPE